MTKPVEVMRKALIDKGGDHLISVRLLHEYGITNGYLDAQKMRDLWMVFKDNPVLFSDEVEGSFERFFDIMMDSKNIWFELFDEISYKPIGLYYLTDIYPGYEAKGHFAYWDRIAEGREGLAWKMMEIVFETYNLNRITAEVPAYQSGTIRAALNLGLQHEGVRRGAAKRHGKFVDVVIMGILRSELMEKLNGTAERA